MHSLCAGGCESREMTEISEGGCFLNVWMCESVCAEMRVCCVGPSDVFILESPHVIQ